MIHIIHISSDSDMACQQIVDKVVDEGRFVFMVETKMEGNLNRKNEENY